MFFIIIIKDVYFLRSLYGLFWMFETGRWNIYQIALDIFGSQLRDVFIAFWIRWAKKNECAFELYLDVFYSNVTHVTSVYSPRLKQNDFLCVE